MNLLSIQNDLKGVSDQDLARMMQSPDSTAPSYLVLSEIRRRKDMRTKAGDAPASTVAEDLVDIPQTYSDREGIRSLRVPGYEEEQRDEEADTGAGIEAMRAGGIVRMADGGEVEYLNDDFGLGTPPPPQGNLITNFLGTQSPSQLNAIIERGTPSTVYGSRRSVSAGDAELARVAREMLAQRVAAPPAQATAPAQVDAGRPAPSPEGAAGIRPQSFMPTISAPSQPAASTPAAGPRAQFTAGGSGAAPASAAPRAADINMQDIMRRNMELIPGIPEELMNRLREGRTNEADRRREAQSNALVEAGLRIAASNNPRLAGAIGEGALPAVQGYTQQLGQIRQDRRADLQQEMAAAQADIQRRYMAGQLSVAEYRSAMSEAGATRRTIMQLEAQARQSAASQGAADVRAGRAEDRADARNRMNLERETLRQTALTERANQEARDRLTMSAAQEAARAVRDPMVLLQTRSAIDAERRRANPGATFTPSTDEDVERFLTQRILRTYQNASQGMGQQGGRGGSASQSDPLGLR